MTREKIVRYLGIGYAPALVAEVVGVSASYISQLLKQEEFVAEVAIAKSKTVEAAVERDATYDELEDEAVLRLKMYMPTMTRPRDILETVRTLNAVKRRSHEFLNPNARELDAGTLVVLTLPNVARRTFEVNAQNEVIAIENKPLAPMPLGALMTEIRQVEGERLPNEQNLGSDGKGDGATERLSFRAQEQVVTEDSI